MFTSGVCATTLLLLTSQRHVTFGGVTTSRNDLVVTCTFIQLSSTSAGVKNCWNCVKIYSTLHYVTTVWQKTFFSFHTQLFALIWKACTCNTSRCSAYLNYITTSEFVFPKTIQKNFRCEISSKKMHSVEQLSHSRCIKNSVFMMRTHSDLWIMSFHRWKLTQHTLCLIRCWIPESLL